jgi:FMN hydrolase / 5-amino-6-(5-phospho-D-ribitylamino)uracil phosphatase
VIEAVLFDGDQTLWDFQRVMEFALGVVLSELRLARPGASTDALEITDLYADREHVTRELEGIEFNLARLRRLGFARTLRRLREDGGGATEAQDEELAGQLALTYVASRDQDPALFEDTVPCLEALRADYRLGLLSNGSRPPDDIGLGGYFEAVVFAQDHRVAKPDRGIFSVVEQLMEVAPEALVLVGDHPLNDVIGAKESGWRSVWIDREGDGTYRAPGDWTHRPDAVIRSLDQLPAVLAQF